MITSIELTNFKGLQNLELKDLKPFVIFCGKNNTGKSSVFHSILFIKQSLENGGSFSWDGRFVSLRSYRDVIFNHRIGGSMLFRYNFSTPNEDVIEVEYQLNSTGMPHFRNLKNKVGVENRDGKIYQLAPPPTADIKTGLTYHSGNLSFKPGIGGSQSIINTIMAEIDGCVDVFNTIQYYIPQSNIHEWSTKISDYEPISIHGENVIPNMHYLQSDSNPIFLKIQEALKNLNVSVEHVSSPVRGRGICVEAKSRGIKSNLKLFGDGVNRLISIVTAVESAKEGDVLIFEEPELHLNRGTIEELAKYLLQATRNGIQIFCSTHSFDFINKLWKLKRHGKKAINPEDVTIIKFVEQEDEQEMKYIETSEVDLDIVYKIMRDELKEIFG